MDRRDFLRFGAAAGAATVGTGCVSHSTGPAPAEGVEMYSPEQMDAFLKTLDTGLGKVTQHATLPRFLPKGVVNKFDPSAFGDAHDDEMLRKVLRSLVLSSSFRSLSIEDQAHPGVQSRMWGSMGEMDEAVRGTNALLESLTPTERDDLRQAMRDDPELPNRFVETLDAEAARAGVPPSTRLQLRTAGLHACARIKQSPSLVIDEYTDKCRKTIARSGSNEEILRRTTARIGDEATFAVQERLLAAHERWKIALGQPATYTDGAPGAPPPQPQQNPQQVGFAPPPPNNGAEGLVTAGAVMLGISGALTGLGVGLLFAAGIVGAIVLTVAGVLLLVGLIVLIVGLVRR